VAKIINKKCINKYFKIKAHVLLLVTCQLRCGWLHRETIKEIADEASKEILTAFHHLQKKRTACNRRTEKEIEKLKIVSRANQKKMIFLWLRNVIIFPSRICRIRNLLIPL